jgi:hypothetical protein
MGLYVASAIMNLIMVYQNRHETEWMDHEC